MLDSVRRTGRLVVVEEAPESGGWGSEIVATVVKNAFGALKSAPFRIKRQEVQAPYTKELEARFLPTAEEVTYQLSTYLETGSVPAPWWIREGVAR